MYYFYILYSTNIDKYYLGHTSELEERIRKHNSNHKGFTVKAIDWVLVYSEAYSDKREAFTRKRQVKNWKSRQRVEKLIEKGNI
jgi:putative endonuclease